MDYANQLKQRLKKNAYHLVDVEQNISGEQTNSAFIFNDVSMNFNRKSFDEIQKVDSWKKRLNKKHTHFNDGTFEMQSCNSSDALLMNIFCYPKFKKWKGVQDLLEVNFEENIKFGWNPVFKNEGKNHRTEIDLKIGNVICEAKLTERDFTSKEISVVKKYDDFFTVFDQNYLNINNGKIENYQLIRNILAANKKDYRFILLVDQTRIDLIRSLFSITKAIRDVNLRNKVSYITWQELVDRCGKDLKKYIENKYF